MSVGPGTAISAAGGAAQRTSSGFAREQRSHFQDRLRFLTYIVGGAMLLGPQLILVAWLIGGDSLGNALYEMYGRYPLMGVLLAVSLIAAGVLRRPGLSQRFLGWLDASYLWLVFANFIHIYAREYLTPSPAYHSMTSVVVIMILARALVVPSSPMRTVALSLPAAVAMLAVQLLDEWRPGQFFYNDSTLATAIILDQFLIAMAILLASLASRLGIGLRRSQYEMQQLGQYQLERRIGEGAMGEVYLATHAMLKRPAAVKFLRAEIAGERTLRRFEKEVQQTCRLTHPNTISIFDYGHTPDGVFYYAMEFLEGADLLTIVTEHGPMPPARAIHVLVQALGALNEAHSKGIVHRDIKAANIMLCEQGGEHDIVKLLDFGLVKDLAAADASLSMEGALIGTPETMSPEVAQGKPVGPSSDLYSLSVVGYFLLTGKRIFDVENAMEFIHCHGTADPVPPSARNAGVPQDLEDVLLRGLRKQPEDRWPNAAAMRTALRACADGDGWTPELAAEWWATAGSRA